MTGILHCWNPKSNIAQKQIKKQFTMKKSEFLVLVMDELNTIKKRATNKEISKLDFDRFNHQSAYFCIYGQMS